MKNCYDWHMLSLFTCVNMMELNGMEEASKEFKGQMLEALSAKGSKKIKDQIGCTVDIQNRVHSCCAPADKSSFNWLGMPHFLGMPFVNFLNADQWLATGRLQGAFNQALF